MRLDSEKIKKDKEKVKPIIMNAKKFMNKPKKSKLDKITDFI
jgi:hypothetical protein